MPAVVASISPTTPPPYLNPQSIAVVGATGAVGKEMLNCLWSSSIFANDLIFLFASQHSAGTVLVPNQCESSTEGFLVEAFSVEAVMAKRCKFVLLAVNGSFSSEYGPILSEKGCVVIDNSSAWRYDKNVALIVPELNFNEIVENQKTTAAGPNRYGCDCCENPEYLINPKGCIIANPNCTTAILSMVTHPLHKVYRIKKIIASTYQAASGAGEKGMLELDQAITARANKEPFLPTVFSHNLVGNVIPRIDSMQSNGYSREEMKLVWETQKILNDPSIQLSCTAVRVPTFRAHCVAATIETEKDIIASDLKQLFESCPGVIVKDDPEKFVFPLPEFASGKSEVEVGRIRQNLIFKNKGVDIFVCGDQLLRGAALNAVLIAEAVWLQFFDNTEGTNS